MMSYLWILLLFGALLSGRANTQDEVPTEDAAFHTTLEPEMIELADLENIAVAEEIDPEPTEAGAHEEVTPAEGEAEVAVLSEADPEPEDPAEEESQPDAPADEEPEATTEEEAEVALDGAEESAPEAEQEPIAEQEEEAAAEEEPEDTVEPEPAAVPEPEAAVEPEPATEPEPQPDATAEEEAVTETPESEATPSSQGPAAGAEDPESAGHIPDVDEQPIAGTDASHAHEEHGSEDEGTAGADAAVPHDESAHAGVEVDVGTDIKAQVPSDGGFNLEDALSQDDAHGKTAHSGRSNSVGSVAHVAEATGEDADDGEESGSGSLAAILCAVGVALVGAGAAYFTYQKKKFCFKNLHEDPEAARKANAGEAQSDPQVLSNLLNSS